MKLLLTTIAAVLVGCGESKNIRDNMNDNRPPIIMALVSFTIVVLVVMYAESKILFYCVGGPALMFGISC